MIHPQATEICNDIDDNCNDQIDEGLEVPWYIDIDGDGYGSTELGLSCEPIAGGVENDLDCDDDNSDVYPGNPQMVAGFDSDCDGLKDWYVSIYIAVDDAGTLCIDDQFIGDTGDWWDGILHNVWLQSGHHAIGIKGWDLHHHITAAIAHMELSDGSLWVTDATWVYDPDPEQGENAGGEAGWCTYGFDDSAWNFVLDIGPIGVSGYPWDTSPYIFPEGSPAHWVWDHYPVQLNTQYLRKEFELP
jgi:hypothetical protein